MESGHCEKCFAYYTHAMDDRLLSAAYNLAIEMRGNTRWRDAMNRVGDTEGAAELRKRCPGYSDEEYSRALAKGLFESR